MFKAPAGRTPVGLRGVGWERRRRRRDETVSCLCGVRATKRCRYAERSLPRGVVLAISPWSPRPDRTCRRFEAASWVCLLNTATFKCVCNSSELWG